MVSTKEKLLPDQTSSGAPFHMREEPYQPIDLKSFGCHVIAFRPG